MPKGAALVVVAIATGLALPLLGEQAWWIMPPAAFAIMIALMMLDRRPLTFRWVLLAGVVAAAIGVFLKFT